MGKDTKEMLKKIIANQALILKQLQINHQSIPSTKNESKVKPVAKKAPVKKAAKLKK